MTELGNDVLWSLATCRYFNKLILDYAEKELKKDSRLGLSSTISLLPDKSIDLLKKPPSRELFSKLRYYELVNSYVNGLLNQGFSKGDILNGNSIR